MAGGSGEGVSGCAGGETTAGGAIGVGGGSANPGGATEADFTARLGSAATISGPDAAGLALAASVAGGATGAGAVLGLTPGFCTGGLGTACFGAAGLEAPAVSRRDTDEVGAGAAGAVRAFAGETCAAADLAGGFVAGLATALATVLEAGAEGRRPAAAVPALAFMLGTFF